MLQRARLLLICVLVFGSLTVVGYAQMATPRPAAGVWHLVPADTDEQAIPNHRMDIRLYTDATPFRAAVVNRVTSEDMPYAASTFDGRTLRLQMRAQSGRTQAEMPWLSMEWDGSRFDGEYVDASGAPIAGGVKFKLIHARVPGA